MRRQQALKYPLGLFFFTLLISGCGVKPEAKGDLSRVMVFADEEIYDLCQRQLSAALERVINTPQPETVFNLQRAPFDKLAEFTQAPNVLILGTLEGRGEVSRYAQEMLDEKARKGIEDGVYWFFAKQEAWRRGQLLVVILTNDKEELDSRLQFGGDDLYRTLHQSMMSRLENSLYAKLEQRNLAGEIASKYGFILRVQHDYKLISGDVQRRFLQLRRYQPSRWLTVTWQKGDTLTAAALINERVRIGGLFADSCRIEADYNVIQRDERILPGGLLLRGLWATAKQNIGGGPFFTFGVLDKQSGTVYFIDGAVFNPGGLKLPFLQQVEAMALTFRPGSGK